MNSGFALSRNEEVTLLRSFQDGSQHISATGVFQLHCDFDISLFPFDRQHCFVNIVSSSYVISRQHLHPESFDMSLLTPNEQWDIANIYTKEINLTFQSGRSYSKVVFGFYLERKAQFYGIAMMLPLVATSCIELATFGLPVGDQNRLQLSFTCFLSFTFFISMLTEKLPQNSGNMPYVLISVSAMIGSVCLVIVLQAVAFHLVSVKRKTIGCKTLNEQQCIQLANVINYVSIIFYIIVIIISQIFIPTYIYLKSWKKTMKILFTTPNISLKLFSEIKIAWNDDLNDKNS